MQWHGQSFVPLHVGCDEVGLMRCQYIECPQSLQRRSNREASFLPHHLQPRVWFFTVLLSLGYGNLDAFAANVVGVRIEDAHIVSARAIQIDAADRTSIRLCRSEVDQSVHRVRDFRDCQITLRPVAHELRWRSQLVFQNHLPFFVSKFGLSVGALMASFAASSARCRLM